MTTRSLLRLCAAFVGATGVTMIANPGFVVCNSLEEASLAISQ
jgi:hypothetical protein